MRFHLITSEERLFAYISSIRTILRLPSISTDDFTIISANHDEFVAFLTPLLSSRVDAMQLTKPCEKSAVADHAPSLEHLVINVSQRCNLSCRYCYASEMNSANVVMSLPTAANLLENLPALAPHGLKSIKFLGGEPTLAFSTIEFLINGVIDYSTRAGVAVPSFVIVTNGTKISEHIADYCHKYGIFVWLSMDGPAHIHNLLRPHRNGAPSHDQALRALHRLLENNVEVGIESVYTSLHVDGGIHPSDLMTYIRQLGVNAIHLTPAMGKSHGLSVENQDDYVVTEFARASREAVKSLTTKHPFVLRGIQFVLRGLITCSEQEYFCGAGRTFMAINADGELFPCYLMQAPEFSYGKMCDGLATQTVDTVKSRFICNKKDINKRCRSCWARELCELCLGVPYYHGGDIGAPPEWYCDVQKSVIAATLEEVALAFSGPRKNLFLDNVRKSMCAGLG